MLSSFVEKNSSLTEKHLHGSADYFFNTITVTSLADNTDADGLVTLREAIQAAETDMSVDGSESGSGPDVIMFDISLVLSGDQNIFLSAFDTGLDSLEAGPTAYIISTDISIIGPSGGNGITLFAAGSRIFHVQSGGSLAIENLTLKNGSAQGGKGGSGGGGGGGGGAGLGGAIFNQGLLSVVGCTFVENQAIGGDGGNGNGTGHSISEGGGGGGMGQSGGTGRDPDNANKDQNYGGGPLGGLNQSEPGGYGGGGAGAGYHKDHPSQGGAGGFGGGAGGGQYRGCSRTSCSATAGHGNMGGFGGGGSGGGGTLALGTPTAGNGGSGGFGGGGGNGGNYYDAHINNGIAGSGGSGGLEGGDGVSGTGGTHNNGGNDSSGEGGGGAGMGGAIFMDGGQATIINSTFCSNEAIGGNGGGESNVSDGGAGAGLGGAIFNRSGLLSLINCTLDANSAIGGTSGDGSITGSQGNGRGGAIYNLGDTTDATIELYNTIVSNSTGEYDLVGNGINGGSAIFNGSHNIVMTSDGVSGLSATINTNPGLEELADNGGPTFTKSIILNSPAMDAGTNTQVTETADQRNGVYARIFDANTDGTATVDIGAYEIVFVDFGDAPDVTGGVGQVPLIEEVGSDVRISDMGDDTETDPSLRDNYRASNPAIAYNATNNEFLVVWYSDNDEGSIVDNENEIYGQRINATTGQQIGSDFRISFQGTDGVGDTDALNASVAWNSTDNQYLVVWNGDGEGTTLLNDEYEIFGQLLAADGTSVGNNFRISDVGLDLNASYDAYTPDVVYNATDNEYLVVWHGTESIAPMIPGENEIFGQRLSNTGAEVGANDFRISDMGDDSETDAYERSYFSGRSTAVAWDEVNNKYLVVWYGNDDKELTMSDYEVEVWGQLLANDGTEIGNNDFRISMMGPDGVNSGYNVYQPDVAFNNKNGQYCVTWYGNDFFSGDNDIYIQRLNTDGSWLGSELQVSTLNPADPSFDQANPAVTWNSTDNEFVIAFQGETDDGNLVDGEVEIYIQRIDSTGAMAGNNTRISDMGPDGDANYDASNAAITYNSGDNIVGVAWQGEDDSAPLVDGENEIFMQAISKTVVTNYATSGGNDGPMHLVDPNLFIGDTIDNETLALGSDLADGDDNDQSDDEDGVSVSEESFKEVSGGGVKLVVPVTNLTADTATLYGWIDFDQDGVFANDGIENASIQIPDGSDSVIVTLNFTGTAGEPTFARLRLSTDTNASSPTGGAADGEVEDYFVTAYGSSDCLDTLHVDDEMALGLDSPSTVSAIDYLSSDASLPAGAELTFRSGNQIELMSEFSVPAGTIFLLLNEDCSEEVEIDKATESDNSSDRTIDHSK